MTEKTEIGAVKRYAERNVVALDRAGGYYGRHVSALTREGLHAKSDIAAELGQRDMQIDALVEQRDRMREALKEYGEHKASCNDHPKIPDGPWGTRLACNCGFDAVLASSGERGK